MLTFEIQQSLRGSAESLQEACISNDGNSFIAVDRKAIRLWSMKKLVRVVTWPTGYRYRILGSSWIESLQCFVIAAYVQNDNKSSESKTILQFWSRLLLLVTEVEVKCSRPMVFAISQDGSTAIVLAKDSLVEAVIVKISRSDQASIDQNTFPKRANNKTAATSTINAIGLTMAAPMNLQCRARVRETQRFFCPLDIKDCKFYGSDETILMMGDHAIYVLQFLRRDMSDMGNSSDHVFPDDNVSVTAEAATVKGVDASSATAAAIEGPGGNDVTSMARYRMVATLSLDNNCKAGESPIVSPGLQSLKFFNSLDTDSFKSKADPADAAAVVDLVSLSFAVLDSHLVMVLYTNGFINIFLSRSGNFKSPTSKAAAVVPWHSVSADTLASSVGGADNERYLSERLLLVLGFPAHSFTDETKGKPSIKICRWSEPMYSQYGRGLQSSYIYEFVSSGMSEKRKLVKHWGLRVGNEGQGGIWKKEGDNDVAIEWDNEALPGSPLFYVDLIGEIELPSNPTTSLGHGNKASDKIVVLPFEQSHSFWSNSKDGTEAENIEEFFTAICGTLQRRRGRRHRRGLICSSGGQIMVMTLLRPSKVIAVADTGKTGTNESIFGGDGILSCSNGPILIDPHNNSCESLLISREDKTIDIIATLSGVCVARYKSGFSPTTSSLITSPLDRSWGPATAAAGKGCNWAEAKCTCIHYCGLIDQVVCGYESGEVGIFSMPSATGSTGLSANDFLDKNTSWFVDTKAVHSSRITHIVTLEINKEIHFGADSYFISSSTGLLLAKAAAMSYHSVGSDDGGHPSVDDISVNRRPDTSSVVMLLADSSGTLSTWFIPFVDGSTDRRVHRVKLLWTEKTHSASLLYMAAFYGRDLDCSERIKSDVKKSQDENDIDPTDSKFLSAAAIASQTPIGDIANFLIPCSERIIVTVCAKAIVHCWQMRDDGTLVLAAFFNAVSTDMPTEISDSKTGLVHLNSISAIPSLKMSQRHSAQAVGAFNDEGADSAADVWTQYEYVAALKSKRYGIDQAGVFSSSLEALYPLDMVFVCGFSNGFLKVIRLETAADDVASSNKNDSVIVSCVFRPEGGSDASSADEPSVLGILDTMDRSKSSRGLFTSRGFGIFSELPSSGNRENLTKYSPQILVSYADSSAVLFNLLSSGDLVPMSSFSFPSTCVARRMLLHPFPPTRHQIDQKDDVDSMTGEQESCIQRGQPPPGGDVSAMGCFFVSETSITQLLLWSSGVMPAAFRPHTVSERIDVLHSVSPGGSGHVFDSMIVSSQIMSLILKNRNGILPEERSAFDFPSSENENVVKVNDARASVVTCDNVDSANEKTPHLYPFNISNQILSEQRDRVTSYDSDDKVNGTERRDSIERDFSIIVSAMMENDTDKIVPASLFGEEKIPSYKRDPKLLEIFNQELRSSQKNKNEIAVSVEIAAAVLLRWGSSFSLRLDEDSLVRLLQLSKELKNKNEVKSKSVSALPSSSSVVMCNYMEVVQMASILASVNKTKLSATMPKSSNRSTNLKNKVAVSYNSMGERSVYLKPISNDVAMGKMNGTASAVRAECDSKSVSMVPSHTVPSLTASFSIDLEATIQAMPDMLKRLLSREALSSEWSGDHGFFDVRRVVRIARTVFDSRSALQRSLFLTNGVHAGGEREVEDMCRILVKYFENQHGAGSLHVAHRKLISFLVSCERVADVPVISFLLRFVLPGIMIGHPSLNEAHLWFYIETRSLLHTWGSVQLGDLISTSGNISTINQVHWLFVSKVDAIRCLEEMLRRRGQFGPLALQRLISSIAKLPIVQYGQKSDSSDLLDLELFLETTTLELYELQQYIISVDNAVFGKGFLVRCLDHYNDMFVDEVSYLLKCTERVRALMKYFIALDTPRRGVITAADFAAVLHELMGKAASSESDAQASGANYGLIYTCVDRFTAKDEERMMVCYADFWAIVLSYIAETGSPDGFGLTTILRAAGSETSQMTYRIDDQLAVDIISYLGLVQATPQTDNFWTCPTEMKLQFIESVKSSLPTDGRVSQVSFGAISDGTSVGRRQSNVISGLSRTGRWNRNVNPTSGEPGSMSVQKIGTDSSSISGPSSDFLLGLKERGLMSSHDADIAAGTADRQLVAYALNIGAEIEQYPFIPPSKASNRFPSTSRIGTAVLNQSALLLMSLRDFKEEDVVSVTLNSQGLSRNDRSNVRRSGRSATPGSADDKMRSRPQSSYSRSLANLVSAEMSSLQVVRIPSALTFYSAHGALSADGAFAGGYVFEEATRASDGESAESLEGTVNILAVRSLDMGRKPQSKEGPAVTEDVRPSPSEFSQGSREEDTDSRGSSALKLSRPPAFEDYLSSPFSSFVDSSREHSADSSVVSITRASAKSRSKRPQSSLDDVPDSKHSFAAAFFPCEFESERSLLRTSDSLRQSVPPSRNSDAQGRYSGARGSTGSGRGTTTTRGSTRQSRRNSRSAFSPIPAGPAGSLVEQSENGQVEVERLRNAMEEQDKAFAVKYADAQSLLRDRGVQADDESQMLRLKNSDSAGEAEKRRRKLEMEDKQRRMNESRERELERLKQEEESKRLKQVARDHEEAERRREEARRIEDEEKREKQRLVLLEEEERRRTAELEEEMRLQGEALQEKLRQEREAVEKMASEQRAREGNETAQMMVSEEESIQYAQYVIQANIRSYDQAQGHVSDVVLSELVAEELMLIISVVLEAVGLYDGDDIEDDANRNMYGSDWTNMTLRERLAYFLNRLQIAGREHVELATIRRGGVSLQEGDLDSNNVFFMPQTFASDIHFNPFNSVCALHAGTRYSADAVGESANRNDEAVDDVDEIGEAQKLTDRATNFDDLIQAVLDKKMAKKEYNRKLFEDAFLRDILSKPPESHTEVVAHESIDWHSFFEGIRIAELENKRGTTPPPVVDEEAEYFEEKKAKFEREWLESKGHEASLGLVPVSEDINGVSLSISDGSASVPRSLLQTDNALPKCSPVTPMPFGKVKRGDLDIGKSDYYQIFVTDPEVVLTIELSCILGIAQLYVANGRLPSPTDFDQRGTLFLSQSSGGSTRMKEKVTRIVIETTDYLGQLYVCIHSPSVGSRYTVWAMCSGGRYTVGRGIAETTQQILVFNKLLAYDPVDLFYRLPEYQLSAKKRVADELFIERSQVEKSLFRKFLNNNIDNPIDSLESAADQSELLSMVEKLGRKAMRQERQFSSKAVPHMGRNHSFFLHADMFPRPSFVPNRIDFEESDYSAYMSEGVAVLPLGNPDESARRSKLALTKLSSSQKSPHKPRRVPLINVPQTGGSVQSNTIDISEMKAKSQKQVHAGSFRISWKKTPESSGFPVVREPILTQEDLPITVTRVEMESDGNEGENFADSFKYGESLPQLRGGINPSHLSPGTGGLQGIGEVYLAKSETLPLIGREGRALQQELGGGSKSKKMTEDVKRSPDNPSEKSTRNIIKSIVPVKYNMLPGRE